MQVESSINRVDVKVFPPGPKSQALLERLDKAIGRTNYTGLYGIVLDVYQGGDGPYMTDLDGNVYLDCLAAASVNVLGYGHEEISKKLEVIASSTQNSGFIYSPNVPAVELAETLISITPGTQAKRVLLGLSGSDSNGGALEAVRKFTHKQGIIHFKNAWHGSTGLSQCASAFGDTNKGIYPPSPKFVAVDFPTTQEKMQEVLDTIQKHLESGRVGGVIAEIIQGDAGIQMPADGFFRALQNLLRRYGALLIVDEIQSGMGRTGKWWACEHVDIIPDLLVAAKGLGGGFAPISAVVGRQDVLDALEPGQQIFTFTGHPGCAYAASLVIESITNNGIIQHVESIGELLKQELKDLQQRYPQIILDVRGKGLMLGMEINIKSDSMAGIIFATRSVEMGVYVGFFGMKKEVVRIEPPLTINRLEVHTIVSKFKNVAEEMRTGQIPYQTVENANKYAIGL